MLNLLMVAVGGALGAIGRYAISDWLHRCFATSFPIGTLAVNVIGCLLIGLAVQASEASRLSPQLKMLLVTGLLGALTTFSTFGHETIHSLNHHGWRMAMANVLANLIIGFLAVLVGLLVGRLFFR